MFRLLKIFMLLKLFSMLLEFSQPEDWGTLEIHLGIMRFIVPTVTRPFFFFQI